MSEELLLQPAFLFRFAVPLQLWDGKWTKRGVKLGEPHRLPPLERLSEAEPFADVRIGWNQRGIAIALKTVGKSQLPWCRDSRPYESDGLQLCIDTRDSVGIHRANRFCHRFALSPFGGGPKRDQPFSALLAIDRAKEQPAAIETQSIKLVSKPLRDGYELHAWIPAQSMTGFDADEYSQLRMTYVVFDRELGQQCWTLDTSYPLLSDPSLWTAVQLTAETAE